jgi:rfaE bifunctional protein nucleotidyltransferase chain/domain
MTRVVPAMRPAAGRTATADRARANREALGGLSPAAHAALRFSLAASSAEQARTIIPQILAAARLLTGSVMTGGTVLTFGNGGSAGDAQHLAAELVGRFRRERRGLPAIALTSDPSTLTGIANDYGYEHVFRRQIEALGCPGDVAIGFTTSGTSPNVLLGLQQARTDGIATIMITGGEPRHDLADFVIAVPGATTAERQQLHLVVVHLLAEFIDEGILIGPDDVFGPDGSAVTAPSRVLPMAELAALGTSLRATGHRIVWTNGVFDLLHAGHLGLLEYARAQGDVLVVGINSDRSTATLKGPDRPVITETERAQLLAALRPVDFVAVFDELDPSEGIRLLRPHVHVKDSDYEGRPLAEDAVLAEVGATTSFFPRVPGRSSTGLIAATTAAGSTGELSG